MKITGRCYCGKTEVHGDNHKTVLYCHCADCRRSAGAPVTAFVEFDMSDVQTIGDDLRSVSVNDGVTRMFCSACGSPIAGTYDYLPGMIYVSLGLLDQADALEPQTHAHHHSKISWLHIEDDLERTEEYRLDQKKGR